MPKPMKFTFKTEKEKWYPDRHYIKYKRKEVGMISEGKGLNPDYRVRLMVKKERTEQDPAPFKWITLKVKKNTLQELKDFLNENIKAIFDIHDLYFSED